MFCNLDWIPSEFVESGEIPKWNLYSVLPSYWIAWKSHNNTLAVKNITRMYTLIDVKLSGLVCLFFANIMPCQEVKQLFLTST